MHDVLNLLHYYVNFDIRQSNRKLRIKFMWITESYIVQYRIM